MRAMQEILIAGVVGAACGALAAVLARRRKGTQEPSAAAPDFPAPGSASDGAAEERLQRREESLRQREEALDRREARVNEAQAEAETRAQALRERSDAWDAQEAARRAEVQAALDDARRRLEETAGLSEADARERVLGETERLLVEERARRVARAVEAARAEADERAREIVLAAIERTAVAHAVEATACRVPIANDDLKGRVIGREGRNARAFEMATGCTLVVDETPGSVTISGFDPIRREVARRALVVLLEDGRVQPSRIEEVVADVRTGMDRHLLEEAESACRDAGVADLHPQLKDLIGRLRYRTSYGQNVLKHAVEAAHLAGSMAADLGLDPRIARRAALLHDAGKAVDPALEGNHDLLAADLASRCGEPPEVVNAIAASHEESDARTPYAVLARVADAVSAARPGARREEHEKVVRRLKDLETVAGSFPGVAHVYALQAGREVRVIVDAGKVDDGQASRLAHDIARALESRLVYPGEVKVTVVREVRATDIAR